MPSRAFIDFDEIDLSDFCPLLDFVLMPSRAFIDSDGHRLPRPRGGDHRGLNALTGIY